jgi:hypothetical protein
MPSSFCAVAVGRAPEPRYRCDFGFQIRADDVPTRSAADVPWAGRGRATVAIEDDGCGEAAVRGGILVACSGRTLTATASGLRRFE